MLSILILSAVLSQPGDAVAWQTQEENLLSPVQLTTRDRFLKAGEAYFSPDGRWIIFQAIAAPPRGVAPDPAAGYSMYIAGIDRAVESEGKLGAARGLLSVKKISPDDSINTCGWFHPSGAGQVIYGSTLTPPKPGENPGFKVGSNRYVWAFPEEMEVVQGRVESIFLDDFARREAQARRSGVQIDRAATVDTSVTPLFSRPGYDAECSFSPDGRYVLYAHVEPVAEDQKPDADIWVYEVETQKQVRIVQAPGYDGGPFFSPDGKWICYRSDRNGDDKLQLFVAQLKFEGEQIVGMEKEFQLTEGENVNWCPYWHPSGKFLVFASSAVGHSNYEVFSIEVDREALLRGEKPRAAQRVTFAPGADVLPAFSPDGKLMMWTSQRGPKLDEEQRPSSQIWVAEWVDPKDSSSAQ